MAEMFEKDVSGFIEERDATLEPGEIAPEAAAEEAPAEAADETEAAEAPEAETSDESETSEEGETADKA